MVSLERTCEIFARLHYLLKSCEGDFKELVQVIATGFQKKSVLEGERWSRNTQSVARWTSLGATSASLTMRLERTL